MLVGAHAVYLYTGDTDVSIATSTSDSDIAVVPDRLGTGQASRPPQSTMRR